MSNPALWSKVGFWTLIFGLTADIVIIVFGGSGKKEKMLSAIATGIIIVGILVEHVADNRRFAPRMLTPKQQQRIASTLEVFAGQQFDLAVMPADLEASNFIKYIEAILPAAGWSQIDWRGPGGSGHIMTLLKNPDHNDVGEARARGLTIEVESGAPEGYWKAAEALASAFDAEGIKSRAFRDRPPRSTRDAIHVLIGKKGLS